MSTDNVAIVAELIEYTFREHDCVPLERPLIYAERSLRELIMLFCP
jgi:hypothetical protein